MGTVALTSKVNGVEDNRRFVDCLLTLSASYATDGDTLSIADLPFKNVDRMYVKADSVSQDGTTIQLAGTSTAPKVKAHASDGTEVVNATNVSALEYNVRIVGH